MARHDDTQKKIFTAGFLTETTDFSPIATRNEQWRVETASGGQENASRFRVALSIFRDMARERGWDVVEGICATAFPPGGRIVRSVYEEIKMRILTDLQHAMPLDGVLLQLHGAALAYGCDDCEGDLLNAIREVVGSEATIGVELDPHCHMTEEMRRSATIMVLYKTFAHTDIEERARELFELTADAMTRNTRPVMAIADCKMVDLFDDKNDPMRSFLDTVIKEEKSEGILSISPVHGFPYADVKEMGSKMLVIANKDSNLAQETADRLAKKFFAVRGQMDRERDILSAVDEAYSRAATGQKGIHIVEWSDLAGCGFPTDGTELLRTMLDRGLTDLALACLWDPMAVSICHDAGAGVELNLRFGGKASAMSGQPIDLDVVVERIYKDIVISSWDDSDAPCDAAVVRSGQTEVLLTSRRILGTGLGPFYDLGIVPSEKTYLLTKFSAGDECARPVQNRAILAFGKRTDLRSRKFQNVPQDMWPWNEERQTQRPSA